jgi:hypothetical protein
MNGLLQFTLEDGKKILLPRTKLLFAEEVEAKDKALHLACNARIGTTIVHKNVPYLPMVQEPVEYLAGILEKSVLATGAVNGGKVLVPYEQILYISEGSPSDKMIFCRAVIHTVIRTQAGNVEFFIRETVEHIASRRQQITNHLLN